MKTRTLRFRLADMDDFERVRKGIKSVETRAGTAKYQSLEVGDTLIFVCGTKKFSKVISKKYHFKSINALFKKIALKKVMPTMRSVKEAEKIYHSYQNYKEKIKEFGILAFELK